MIDRINEDTPTIISNLIQEEYNASNANPDEIYQGSTSKFFRADGTFLRETSDILIDAANNTGCPDIGKIYRLSFPPLNDRLYHHYLFQVIITETRNPFLGSLALLTPDGLPYMRISPQKGVEVNITSLLPEDKDLPISNLSFSSTEPLLDAFKLCEAVQSLRTRRAQKEQKVGALNT